MLIPFGILSAAGAEVLPPFSSDYELIETHIVSGTSTTSVTFGSLGTYSADYKSLQIRYLAKHSGQERSMDIRFNNNTGANYARHALGTDGSGAGFSFGSTSQTSMRLQDAVSTSTTANAFGAGVVDITDPFSTTRNKTLRAFYGITDSNTLLHLTSGLFINTGSLTTIQFFIPSSGNWVAGSRFSLYGLRG